jgi:hypothetical protein
MRSTSRRSCARSGRGSATSAASTTPRNRSRNWRARGSRSSSTRGASARTSSSSTASSARAARRRRARTPSRTRRSSTPTRRSSASCGGCCKPILKLFFNYNVLNHVLHTQAEINTSRDEQDLLAFEVMHNLVVEMTRTSIEVKNLRMKLESVQSRLEFNERRARALEAVVQYKPEAVAATRGEAPPAPGTEPQGGVDPITGGDSLRTKRRRRRRGRRTGQAGAGVAAENGEALNGEEEEGRLQAPGSRLQANGRLRITGTASSARAATSTLSAPRRPGARSPEPGASDQQLRVPRRIPSSGSRHRRCRKPRSRAEPGFRAGSPILSGPAGRRTRPREAIVPAAAHVPADEAEPQRRSRRRHRHHQEP